MKKKWIYAFLLVMVVAAIWGYRLYSRKSPDQVQARPELEVAAAEIVQKFEQNGQAADKQYGGKTIRVSGTVIQVSAAGSVVLGSGAGTSEIVIGLDQRHKDDARHLRPGVQATFQGVYSGYEGGGGNGDDLLGGLGTTIHLRSGGLINKE